MSNANFVPEIWSARVLWNFRQNYVYRGLCNTDYEGEIQGAGDTVRINTPGAVTVNDYAGSITYEKPQSTQQALLIDQEKYFAVTVDDVDQVQASVDLIDMNTVEAGQAMAKKVDQDISGLYTTIPASMTVALDVSSNSDGVWIAITGCSQVLDENDVPDQGRWLIVSPLVYAKMKNHSNFIHASDMGDDVIRTGQLGQIDNFGIFKSNNVTVATQHKCTFGHTSAITFAEQLVKLQSGIHEDEFGEFVRGLMVYGRKIIRPTAFGLLNVTVA